MSRGLPSMTALLGLLAVAGYQNRDKLAEMLNGHAGQAGSQSLDRQQGGMASASSGAFGGSSLGGGGFGGGGGLGGILGGLLGGLGGSSAGGILSGGLSELVDRFRQNGQGETADSWVSRGPNREVAPHQLEQAIGPDVMANLSQQTGLSRDELLSRLSRELPRAVDDYTPEGHLPTQDEIDRSGLSRG